MTRPIYIIDFSTDKAFESVESESNNVSLGILFTMIMQQYFAPRKDSSEYRVSHIITDHLRKTGIDGIAYKSFYDKNGTNYTIFNSSRDRFKFLDSRLLLLQSERRTFLDFNEKRVVKASTMGYAEYNEQDANEMLNEINIKISKEVNPIVE